MTKKDDHATKEDIALVKKDIAGVKEDISRLESSTKADISRLDAKIDRVAGGLVNLQDEVRGIKAGMSTKDDIERVMRHIDKFAADAVHYARADATRGETLVQAELRWQDHERRITALESAQPRPETPGL